MNALDLAGGSGGGAGTGPGGGAGTGPTPSAPKPPTKATFSLPPTPPLPSFDGHLPLFAASSVALSERLFPGASVGTTPPKPADPGEPRPIPRPVPPGS